MPITVNIPDKNMTVNFPDSMTPHEIEQAIITHVYNMPVMSQGKEPSTFDTIKNDVVDFFSGKGSTVGPLTEQDKQAFEPTAPNLEQGAGGTFREKPLMGAGGSFAIEPPNAWDMLKQFNEDISHGELPEGLGYLQKPIEHLVDMISSKTKWTPKDEMEMARKHPNLMAARYALLKLVPQHLVPGMEWLTSPTDWEDFKRKSTNDQRLEILGETAGWEIGLAAGKIGGKLAGLALRKLPLLRRIPWDKPLGKFFTEADWFRNLTNRERAIVVLTVDDMKKAGWSDAKILRSLKSNPEQYNKYYQKVWKRNGGGAKAEPQGPIMPPEPPAEPKQPSGAPLGLPEGGKRVRGGGQEVRQPYEWGGVAPEIKGKKGSPVSGVFYRVSGRKKPIGDFKGLGTFVGTKRIAQNISGGEGKVVPVDIKLSTPFEMSNADFRKHVGFGKPLRDRLEKQGYDGIVIRYKDGSIHEAVVFDPSKVAKPAAKITDQAEPVPDKFKSTNDAEEFGKTATPEQLTEMARRYIEFRDKSSSLREKAKAEKNTAIMDESADNAFNAQFFREAIEAKIGQGKINQDGKTPEEVLNWKQPKSTVEKTSEVNAKSKAKAKKPEANKVKQKKPKNKTEALPTEEEVRREYLLQGSAGKKAMLEAIDKAIEKAPKKSSDVNSPEDVEFSKPATYQGVKEIDPTPNEYNGKIYKIEKRQTDDGWRVAEYERDEHANQVFQKFVFGPDNLKTVKSYVASLIAGEATPEGTTVVFKRAGQNYEFKIPNSKWHLEEFKRRVSKGPKIHYSKTPTSYASTGQYASTISHVIDLPEIVELAKDLSGGKYPKLAKYLRAYGGLASGVFYPRGAGTIKILRSLFEDTGQVMATLSHEIGHLIDYLPDRTLARGNILGSLASLKKYMKHTIARAPGVPGELTAKDRARLKREAQKLISKEADSWIDEVIEKRLPITAKDVLAIWNSLEDARLLNKGLYDYIASLSTPQKKAVIASALKGVVKEELQRFSKVVKEATGKKIKQTLSDEEFKKRVAKKYAELVNKELAKRKLFNVNQIMEELKTFSVTWKPFNPDADPKFTKYRFSPRELYADAFSGLVNAPGLLKAKAPNFYEGFFNYLGNKPNVKGKWDEIQRRIEKGPEEVSAHRIEETYEMFKRGHDLRKAKNLEMKGQAKSVLDVLGRGMWDENFPIQKELSRLQKKGGKLAQHAKETKWMLEETEYLASEVNDLVHDINKTVVVPAEQNDISNDDLGVYLMMKHIEMNREGIASTKGFYKQSVQQDLKVLGKLWGKAKYDKVVELAGKLRAIREDRIIPLIEQSGLATPELLKIIRERTFYSKMSVAHWLKDKYGTNVTSRFYRQYGSLEDIENPFIATVLQDIALIRAARLNITKTALVDDLKELNLIQKAPEKFNPKIGRITAIETKDTKLAMFTVIRNGRPVHYHVSKAIADTFNKQPFEATKMAQFWHYASQPIREILVNKNPVWMARNPGRDFLATLKNNPEIKLRHAPLLLNEYRKAWREVWQEAMKGKRSPFISEMYRNRQLLVNRVWGGKEENYEDEIQKIIDSFGMSEKEAKDAIIAVRSLKKAWKFLDDLGRATEIWGKVSGAKYLTKHTNLSKIEIGHRVHGRIGTPNVKGRPAWQQFLNNVFMFSTVGKEGIRAALESFRENPAAYIWKTIVTNMFPKLFLFAAELGALGWYYKKVVDRISEYDKAHYTIIPLYLDLKGKAHYIRIPQDYEGQYFGSIFWKLLHLEFVGPKGAVHELTQAHPYQLHPLLTVGTSFADYYLKGQNPVDDYRGEYILPDRIFQVGGPEAAKYMGRYAWKNIGLNIFYNPSYYDIIIEMTGTEKMLRAFPGNVLGTFYKISDQGLQEQIQAEFNKLRKQKAKQSLALDKALMRMTPKQKVLAFVAGDAVLKKKIQKVWLRQKNTAYSKAIASARSKEEMLVVLKYMIEDYNQLGGK